MTSTPSTGSVRTVHLGGLLVLGSVWGGSFWILKIAVDTVPAATVAASRLVIAAAVLVTVALATGHGLPRSLRAWGHYFLMGAAGVAVPFTLIGWGEITVDSGLAAILMSVSPLATLILAHLLTTEEPMTLPRLAGVLVGLSGVVVLIGPAALQGLGDQAIHQAAVALGAVCYAVGNIIARRLPKHSDTTNSAGIMAAAALLWTPVALVTEQPWNADPSAASMVAVVALALFPTALATLVYLWLIRTAGATFVSLSNYLVPVFGVFWGVAILDETIHPEAAIALVLVLSGIALTRRSRPVPRTTSQGDSP